MASSLTKLGLFGQVGYVEDMLFAGELNANVKIRRCAVSLRWRVKHNRSAIPLTWQNGIVFQNRLLKTS